MSDTTSSQSDDDTTKGTNGGNDTTGGDQSTQGASQTGNDTSQGDDTSSGDTTQTVSQEEYDKVVARMKAADKRASDAEKVIEDAKRKDATELENAQADLKKATDRVSELEGALQSERIQNAFLASNKHSWHDPKDALALLDMSGVTVNEDGTVSGMDAAIDKLAKDKKHLVKDDDGDGNSSGASGSPRNGRRSGTRDEPDVKKLGQRFPALQKR